MGGRAFEAEVEVRYRETDSLGHVSSPVYYEYMQLAYLKYMRELIGKKPGEKMPHVMVSTSCDYLRPVKDGDVLRIQTRVTKFGKKSFELEYEMRRDGQEDIAAKGRSVHVMFDYAIQSTMAVPQEFVDRVIEYQGSV